MDRTALRTYLASTYDVLLGEAGIGTTDTGNSDLKPVLDAVATWDGLDPALSPLWINPLGRFYALDRIVNRFAANMDVTMATGGSYRLQQQYANAKQLLDLARLQVAWIVEPVPSTAGRVVTISAPFLTGGEDVAEW